MNRNLKIATAMVFAVTVGAGKAVAQDDVIECIDPTVMNPPSPYSNDYNAMVQSDDLIGIMVGLSGTVNFSKFCFPPNGVTLHTGGRVGFFGGPVGSIQDTAYGGPEIDGNMLMTFGMPTGVAGNWGYGVSVRRDTTATTSTRSGFGKNAIDEFFFGASDRYFVVGSTNDNIRITLRVDTLGDTNRLQWTFTNQGAATNIGFDFGQWMYFESVGIPLAAQNFLFGVGATFIDVPGFRPLTTDHRFTRNISDQTQLDPEFPVSPITPYVNFGITRAHAYGLSLPLEPNPSIPDQTAVDILDIGKIGTGWLLGPVTGDSMPMPPYDFKSPKPLLGDTTFQPFTAYVQRWLPTPVAAGGSRVITAYYRTTWGVSDYDKPYSAVVDTPKVVGVQPGAATAFDPNPMAVRVYIDNTRGFSTVDQAIPLNDVRVTLNLPLGMSDANDPTHTRTKIVKTISRVQPQTMNSVDFQVFINPTVYGIQEYNVKIEPNPGPAKTLTGTINVASQPYLLIRPSANLLTAPWTFSSSNWASILNSGPDPLVADVDYQAYEWDAAQQAYTRQNGPRRGFGTWLISNKDAGFKQLGGAPTSPSDLITGADLILLRPGWNLIANPYNYSIPLGQIVGVSDSDPRNSQTLQQFSDSNIINSSLAYWDQNTQGYNFTSGFADLLVPNRGYWIFLNSPSNLTLSFPPVNSAFVPVQPDDPIPFLAKWQLPLTIRNNRSIDTTNVIGTAKDAAMARRGSAMKPPIAPLPTAISGSFVERIGSKTLGYAKDFQADTTQMVWTWSVMSRSTGSTTVSWPVPTSVPSTVQLSITDQATGKSYDMRKVQALSYVAKADVAHLFTITAGTPLPTGPVLGTVTAARSGAGSTSPFAIKYNLAYSASTTIRILKGSSQFAVVKASGNEAGGLKTAYWNLTDASGKPAGKGSYTVEVSATNPGRSVETKQVFVFIY